MPRITALQAQVDLRVFAADEVVPGLLFSQKEIEAFGANGRAMILALADFAVLTKAIPVRENGLLNYIRLTHPRAVRRLDPFDDQSAPSMT